MKTNAVEYFLETRRHSPAKLAVVDHTATWDFHTLDARAQAIASTILSLAPYPNTPIAIYLPKCNEAIASILAVLMCGNCYAPLDTKSPPARLRAVITHLRPSIILTSRDLSRALTDAGYDPSYIVYADEHIPVPECSPPQRWKSTIDTDPAYIIHTSGSTGSPKGVVISHRGIINYIDWARDCFSVDSRCIIGNQAPLIFDNSTLDVFLCLACGATLNLIPEELFSFPVRLLQYLDTNGINFIFWVPSIMVSVAAKGALDRVAGLRLTKILFAGEVMPAKQLSIWRARFPAALFANLYGPTEITVDCTCYIVDRDFRDDESVPIGVACRNTKVLLLNDSNRECRVGEKGELCVRGSCLALGYWNQPQQTAAAFVQNPLNSHFPELIYRTGDIAYLNDAGEIIFVGRRDFQIKHMGYRIEIGDIEHSASKVDGIHNACVLYNSREKTILLVYEAESALDAGALRMSLARNLPKYMLPSVIRRIAAMPRTPTGKIDRQGLAALYDT